MAIKFSLFVVVLVVISTNFRDAHLPAGKRDARCPPHSGVMPVFLTHESDCGRYYVCVTGLAIPMQCPEQLHFNKVKNFCEKAQCQVAKASEVVQSEKPEAGLSRLDPRCPRTNGRYPVFLAHECECGRYYVCDHGMAILMRCPAHLHFNTRLDVCDDPYDVKCDIETPAKAVASEPVPPVITSLYGSALSPGKPDHRCPDHNGNLPVFLRRESNCGEYYVCDTGLAILMQCPHHLHFNKDKNVCDEQERANCKAAS